MLRECTSVPQRGRFVFTVRATVAAAGIYAMVFFDLLSSVYFYVIYHNMPVSIIGELCNYSPERTDFHH